MPTERVETEISRQELERRWAAVRKEMEARNIDALLMQNASDFLGGYVKWFTDVPGHNHYPRTVLFHREGLMTVFEMGARGRRTTFDGNDPFNPGVGDWIWSAPFFSVVYTHDYDSDIVVAELKKRNYRTLGLLGGGAMPYALVDAVKTRVPNLATVDASDFVDRIKAVKSEEEIKLIWRAARMQDESFARVLKAWKPGMRDSHIAALAQYEGELRGSEQGLFRCSSAPLGQPAVLRGRHYQGRIAKPGDYITLLIENNGPGGYYAELARTMVLGKPSQELVDQFEAVKEAQVATVKRLKPGASCPEIYEAHNAFMTGRGLPPEQRLFGHSQGYDLVERPLLRDDETMALDKGMCMAVHPGVTTQTNFIFVCDNFMMNHDGSVVPMHTSEQRLYEVG
jgi:Xaa-Pro aminopeptidase